MQTNDDRPNPLIITVQLDVDFTIDTSLLPLSDIVETFYDVGSGEERTYEQVIELTAKILAHNAIQSLTTTGARPYLLNADVTIGEAN